jgi:hypothetical protein
VRCNQLLLLGLFIAVFVSSCAIEKRRYSSGYHIEWLHSGNESLPEPAKTPDIDSTVAEFTKPAIKTMNSSDEPEEKISETLVVSPLEEVRSVESVPLNSPKPVQIRAEIEYHEIPKSNSKEQQTARMGILHPDAGASFLLGLLSAGSIVAMFLLGLSPLWAIAALFAIGIACGFIAVYLARRAMNDFYQGRDRFSGQPLAVAGMILGVLSLVVLIGAIVIFLLGLIFVNLT